MARGRTGGDDGRKSLTFGDLHEQVEQLLALSIGVTAGAAPSIIRGITTMLFKDDKDMAKKVETGDVSRIRDSLKKSMQDNGGDKKVAELIDKCLADIVTIRASGKNEAEKDRDIQQARKDYEAAVIKYKYDQTQQDFRTVMTQLSVDANFIFDSWLNNTLTEEERVQIESRKKFINDKKIIWKVIDIGLKLMAVDGQDAATVPELFERWGYVETDEAWRVAWQRASKAMFDHLMTVLPRPSIMEQGKDAVSALLRGEGDKNPVVQSTRKWLKENAAERIAAAKAKLAKHRGD